MSIFKGCIRYIPNRGSTKQFNLIRRRGRGRVNGNERTERSNSRSFSLDREASCCRPATMLYALD
jgi:hypothetical protein